MARKKKKGDVPVSVDVNEDQHRALMMALEFYIRMGLGQFSQIAQRLDLMHGKKIGPEKLERIRQLCEEMEEVLWGDGKPWTLRDDDASLYVLNAFLVETQLAGKPENTAWCVSQIERVKELTGDKIQ